MFELNWLRYLQLKHFVDSLPRPIRLEGNLLPLERMCLAPSGGGGISQIYKILLRLKNKGLPTYIKKWDEELATGDIEKDFGKILKMTHITSTNCGLIEMNFKCLSRWYITPDIAHRFQGETSDSVGGVVRNPEPCHTFGGRAPKSTDIGIKWYH